MIRTMFEFEVWGASLTDMREMALQKVGELIGETDHEAVSRLVDMEIDVTTPEGALTSFSGHVTGRMLND